MHGIRTQQRYNAPGPYMFCRKNRVKCLMQIVL
jgi:hypothetical protein